MKKILWFKFGELQHKILKLVLIVFIAAIGCVSIVSAIKSKELTKIVNSTREEQQTVIKERSTQALMQNIEASKWIQKQADDEWVMQIEDSEYTDFFIHAFDMVRDKINYEEIEVIEKIIDQMDCFAIEYSWKSLHIGCLIKKIHLNGINKHDYETAKILYNKHLEEEMEPVAIAHLCYKMGLLASDNKDFIFAEECFNKSTSKLAYLSDFDKLFCLVNCAIAYSHNMKYDIAKIIIDQAIEKV